MIRSLVTILVMTTALAALAGCATPPPLGPRVARDPASCRQAVPDTGCWPPGVYIYPPLTDPEESGPYRLMDVPVYPPLVIGGQHY